ncbi:MAG TPA: 2-amino-4-hydroxy-6-hydroxymethyldihydropteridine diphosphokinase [Candidatus Omnitrophota bacterium]|nr:2-amino-4-hydroxy-6-hydroxymethyldihydropteridine diphosphokinase [Candidatus Omnitrophota bacterium]HPB67880.1 2-amino-4-hydroxy-6-hydroxymethyldihydropteridine diphosphokinase [Candidatus Omnitrophota bacterium]HQO58781.1 2-amino-4-hydroxy-6-hydroxymethyldihydropteridine diphosphokinase [Candidatus Omnitrophota bacterium]HQP12484.1 2-amino-4-hydroxy-6-hydroxymethyldihydropteridine diphosphokinase [Candidatus Omnitrophota bacterium]
MSDNLAIIGLGSNIDPEKNIPQALRWLREEFGIEKQSSFLRTRPVGNINQEDFLNGCALIRTGLDKDALAARLKQIERELGRVRTADKYGPRVIDLDVLTFNGKVEDPDVFKRDFIKTGILEIDPDFCF